MPLQLPEIDSRSYQEILDEVVARIRIHNPEWTNYNESDPGITLLQLFSFMTENLLYRSRLIPDRTRLKFLNLLGIPLQPARAAEGIVAFENQRGPLRAVEVERDTELLAGKIPFRTGNAVGVLPVEGRLYRKAPLPAEREAELLEQYERAYAAFQTGDVRFLLYETQPLDLGTAGERVVDLGTDTVDGALWLALLARTPDLVEDTRRAVADQVLTLGVVADVDESGRVLPPEGGSGTQASSSTLAFQLPRADVPLPSDPSQRVARYRAVETVASGDVLSQPGLVQVSLPGAALLRLWDDLDPNEDGVGDFPPAIEGDDAERVVTWVRIRASDRTAEGVSPQTSVRLAWLGINAALVVQRAQVTREVVGRGTGEPDQSYRLANTPVLIDTLTLEVNGERWQRVDDLMAAGAEVRIGEEERAAIGYGAAGRPVVKAFTVDRASGEIRFGDGIHGARPRAESLIEASYHYGGGRHGLVGPGAVTKGPALPAGVKVNNPIPTWGGDEAMTPEAAERTIPAHLRHRDRAVTDVDFRDVVAAAPGVDLGRIEVLPLFYPQLPDVRSPGVVTVMVIPRYDRAHPDTPAPDRSFRDLVCDHLDPRRVVTTEVHVRGPQYEHVWVSIGLATVPGRDIAPVRTAVMAEVRRFLSALEGGVLGTGWPLSTSVERLELWAAVTRVEGVAKVSDVLLTDESGSAKDRVELSGLQLPRLVAVAAQHGDPRSLAELRGDGPAEPGTVTALPVPVEPAEC
jgi:hypothetical protein